MDSQYSPQMPPRISFPRCHIKIRKNLKKLCVNCSFTTNDRSAADQRVRKISFGKLKIKQKPVEIMVEAIKNMLKALREPAIAALVVGLLLMSDPNSALAASRGRMGGSSFSSRSSSSSSPSRSYSTTSSSPWSDSESSSSSWSYSVSSSSSQSYSASSSPVGFELDFALIMIIASVAFVIVCCFLSEGSQGSVLKLQVGLLGSGRSIQTDLNWIAEMADTSTSEGLHYVLTETVVALLRHPDYCISSYSSVDVKRSIKEGEILFNKLSIEERSKFDDETLVNVNNIKRQSPTILRAGGVSNEYIAVIILLAADGEHKLPSVNNSKDLKEALQKLASIPSSKTKAAQVLWIPQNEDDTLSEQELLEDYPLLRPL